MPAQTALNQTTNGSLALATLDGEPVEKINAAEMGGQSFEHKRGKKGRNRNRGRDGGTKASSRKIAEDPGRPTPERLAKGDGTAKTPGGHYRAPPPIERLRNKLAPDGFPVISEAEYQAALRLQELFAGSGLGAGVQAQDLSRIVVHGEGGVPFGMATSERAAYLRQQFRLACRLMGWFEAYPSRGAGRLVVDVVCFEMVIQDAARLHIGSGRTDTLMGAGVDRLREGLFALAVYWRML